VAQHPFPLYSLGRRRREGAYLCRGEMARGTRARVEPGDQHNRAISWLGLRRTVNPNRRSPPCSTAAGRSRIRRFESGDDPRDAPKKFGALPGPIRQAGRDDVVAGLADGLGRLIPEDGFGTFYASARRRSTTRCVRDGSEDQLDVLRGVSSRKINTYKAPTTRSRHGDLAVVTARGEGHRLRGREIPIGARLQHVNAGPRDAKRPAGTREKVNRGWGDPASNPRKPRTPSDSTSRLQAAASRPLPVTEGADETAAYSHSGALVQRKLTVLFAGRRRLRGPMEATRRGRSRGEGKSKTIGDPRVASPSGRSFKLMATAF